MKSVEHIKQRLAHCQALNPRLNAFVDMFSEQAMAQAHACDAALARGESLGPLHGTAVSVKECFQLRGSKSTVNYPPLRNYQAEVTSPLIQRLFDAGAVVLGKTNVPALLADAQTFGPLYATANNPYDLSCTPGGSTGGGAAAVAAQLVDIELGSDIGGSIRNPASFCGLFGLKPTENGHAGDGHIPPLPGSQTGISVMNSTGPLTRTASDLTRAYKVLFQPDWQQGTYLPVARSQVKPATLAGYRFGYLDTIMGLQPGSEVQRAMDTTVADLTARGASVKKLSLDPQLARELLSLWAELFGFMMGQSLSWPVRKVLYWRFSKLLKSSSLPAGKALRAGLGLDLKRFSRALSRRQEIIAEINRCYAGVDCVINPTALGPAFPHNPGHKPILLDGVPVPYVDYCFPFVMLYNLTGQPVLTVPAGQTQSGLPIGLSFAAGHHQEPTLLHLAQLLESAGYRYHAPDIIT
ncbi:amidase [Pseudidiomarina insulisalsae]|uniref:Amidase domain-containing protein n=1 Tax=Pseudidiomarina insulisalsae TaxID=575789 RepID=A0A432YPT7_9GAMM|nr:amidase family protein [Pseudidiomarina insulisalsae]RUO63140.1 hypothetical protein CWI71_02650 [Pseudidiomarina insulisalsae]